MISALLRAQTPRFAAARFVPRITPTIAVRFNSVNFKIDTDSPVFKYHQDGPVAVKYTSEHEWIALHKDDTAFVGITSYAADALGDATFIELPEIGTSVAAGESIGSVESVKSASEIYAPVGGEVINANSILESEPGVINSDPQGAGWIAHIKVEDPEQFHVSEDLLDEAAYIESLEEH